EPVLRARLHALVEALDAAEHRHRRRRRRRSAARRLGGGDRERDRSRPAPVRDRLLLDPAALLGAGAADQARLRRRRDPDAAGRPRGACDRSADRPLLRRPRRGHGRALPVGHPRTRLARDRPRTADDASPRGDPLPLLAPLPRAALRRRSDRRGRLMLDPETERRNLLWGWGLFVFALLLAAGTVAVAFIYLAVD